jgi:hypothetical protein
LAAETGPTASWFARFIALIISIFVVYIGYALHKTLQSTDSAQREKALEALRELLKLFPGKWHQ